MIVQVQLENRFGTFSGKKVEFNDDSYKKLLDMVKVFYMDGGFELTLEDDTFVVFPPDIVKESILKVIKNGI
jgi:hypothetical protein